MTEISKNPHLWSPLPQVEGTQYIKKLRKGLAFRYDCLNISRHVQTMDLSFKPCVRITILLKGRLEVNFGNTKLQLDSNSEQAGAILSILKPLTGFKNIEAQKNKRELVIFMSLRWLKDSLSHHDLKKLNHIFNKNLNILYFRSTPLITQITNRLCSPRLHSASNLNQEYLCLSLIDEALKQISPKPVVYSSDTLTQSIEKLDLLIRQGLADEFDIQDMAKYCHSNPTTFQRVFKQQFGCTVGNYKRKIMLERAHQALLTGANVTSAAQIAGYDHLQSFSLAFEKVFGSLPSAFKKSS